MTDNVAHDGADDKQPTTFAEFNAFGYGARLVPVIPPNAPPAEKLAKRIADGKPDPRGKAPGLRRHDGRWHGFSEWIEHETTPDDLERYTAWGASIGMKTGPLGDGRTLVCIDADSKNPAFVEIISAEIEERLGALPRRVGDSPKFACPLIVDGEFKYERVDFGEKERVEILAGKRHFVVYGIHPKTERHYDWVKPLPPLDQLKVVTPEELKALLRALEKKLPAAKITQEGGGAEVPQERLRGTLELVTKAVKALPNRTEIFPEREDLVSVGYAIKASLPDHPHEALALFEDWADRWEDPEGNVNADGYAEAEWRRMKPPFRRGASWLYELAHEHGQGKFNLAEVWFQPVDDESPFEAHERATREEARSAGDFLHEPVDLFGHADPGDLSTPPMDTLPSIVARWATDQARRKRTSVAFPAVAALAAIGGAIGNSMLINPKGIDREWEQPAPFWLTLVAKPGSTKSEIVNVAMAPLRALESEWRSIDEPKRAEWLKRSKARRKKDEVPEPLGPEPKVRRLILDDVTMEAQIAIHAANPRGLIRAPDELAGMLDKMGAYKNGPGGDRSNMLRLHDGGANSVDRVGGTSVYAKSALMGLLASTQPEKLRSIVKDLSSDGMLQRMLFVIGDDADREEVDEAPDLEASSEYCRLLSYLARTSYGEQKTVRLSPGAAEVLKAFRSKCDKLKRIPGASDAWAGHLSKWGNFSARFLLIFHAVEQWEFMGVVDPNIPVGEATAKRAVAFCDFMLRHSLAIYETYFGHSAPASEARLFAGYLLAHPDVTEFTPRDVYQARTNLKGKENRGLLFDAIEELVAAGWCSVAARNYEGPTLLRVNPRIHERFAEQGKREAIERARRQEQIRLAGIERKRLVSEDKMSEDA